YQPIVGQRFLSLSLSESRRSSPFPASRDLGKFKIYFTCKKLNAFFPCILLTIYIALFR
ncbi:hypothetical protein L9F63_013408, partial [Diploptera punctata]